MRILLIALFAVLASPAFAQSWGDYDNARFGYVGGIPPDFSGYGESQGREGETFDLAAKGQVLSYWAEKLDGDLATTLAASIGYAERDGWNISYRVETPTWGGFEGINGLDRFYRHMIALCDGQNYAVMTVQYSALHAAEMKPVVDRLVEGFAATGC